MNSDKNTPNAESILTKWSEKYDQKTANYQKMKKIIDLHPPTGEALQDKLDENFGVLAELGGDAEKRYGMFLDQTYSLAAIDGELSESFVGKLKDILQFLIENPTERFSSVSSRKEKVDPWGLYQRFYDNVEKISNGGGSKGGKVLVENADEWFDYFDKEFDFYSIQIDNYFDIWYGLTKKIVEVHDGATRSVVARAAMDTIKALKEKEPKPDDCYKFYCEFEYAVEKVKELERYSTTAARAFAENLPRIVKYPGVLADYDYETDRRKQEKWDIFGKGEYHPLIYDTPSRFKGLNLLVTHIKILEAEGKLETLVKDFRENPDEAIDKYFGFVKLGLIKA